MSTSSPRTYRSAESKYKGGAKDMFVTYDLSQRTRGGGTALYPKVRRVYIAGDLKDVSTGVVRKRSGREVQGVHIEYAQTRKGYRRHGFTGHRKGKAYAVQASSVGSTSQRFAKVVEVPEEARNVHFYPSLEQLPDKYQHALQRAHVRQL